MTSPITAIILAAGASARLGYRKQTLVYKGETLLDRAVRIAREAGVPETVVVLGAFADEIARACRLEGCTVVHNADWMKGMGTSIRCGVDAVARADAGAAGAVVLVCDMPAVTAEHLRALKETGRLTASLYDGKRGVPAYFPRAIFPELLKLEDARGANHLLLIADTVTLTHGNFDIDTLADAAQLNRFENGPA